ncbi:hypothetical protein RHGRI_000507 [Rhododendron griersonianum]|uniref:Uncharacterized protein n=1 Tax=Rhododendron griersonianum TaxID=479676 RepID=A0AAV6LGV1_9ERIC|nr:hypothetical protein RHGRI_000507 [Rhododendron griersonianum]
MKDCCRKTSRDIASKSGIWLNFSFFVKASTDWETVVKVAESVNHAVAPTAAATSSPPDAASPVGTHPPPPHVATGRTAARKKAARHGRRKTAARKKATRAADKDPTKQITAHKSSAQANIDDSTVAPHSPVSDTPRETSHHSTEIDMDTTSAAKMMDLILFGPETASSASSEN